MVSNFKTYLNKTSHAAPLVVFRICFGLLMLQSIVRFWAKGWIYDLYIQPKFHFTYYNFEWVKPIGNYTYLLFIICAVAAILIAIGYKYRLAVFLFFISFTYIELMDKTSYLNHYYFVSVLSFLMFFIPANAYFSVDALVRKKAFKYVPSYTIDSIKLLLSVVYFYAGLAKINSDWLFRAMPLKIWLPSKYDIPFIGNSLLQQEWMHYFMSWSGMLYDLFIPFLLLYKRTRILAFVAVVVFHLFTRILFPIGMFPYIMIVSSLIFFSDNFHIKIINYIRKIISKLPVAINKNIAVVMDKNIFSINKKRLTLGVLAVFFTIQLLLPFRYLLYPGELFWTEEGYRFSWRVMLVEKMGYANFKIVDSKTKKQFYVDNADFLTPFQEKQMSTQPDFIVQYAHYLGDHFKKQNHKNIQVFVESYVAFNGRLSRPYINPKVDLYKEKDLLKHKTWILPFNDEIKGF
ncbi:vitamin K-dependent gamma-carboxylase-like protein [Cellulophaga sp. RHA19]|uniref:HTTM domain-containing protein n=1 Tax=Cellulophaga sp. RHA19 TaxID=1798237 RepID=UPI000C2BF312|nr:HTTM domain-containing protein [Cellulophaga sp. RHA19]PKB43867.1 vitamin K-dependent gamma-carboxylase-like protein [Cellulophaga sp. RHA19]